MNKQNKNPKVLKVVILLILVLVLIKIGQVLMYSYSEDEANKERAESYREYIKDKPLETNIIVKSKESNNSKDDKASTSTLENIVTPAYLASIENNKITIDYFEILYGEDAKKAVVEDGVCTQKEIDEHDGCFPNGDIYDRNRNPKLRTFELAPDVTIITATAFMTNPNGVKNISVAELKRDYIRVMDGKVISPPYEITIKNSVVTKIVEIYRP